MSPNSAFVRVVLRIAAALVCAPGAAGAQTHAAPPNVGGPEAAFVHESWTVRDGLPLNSLQYVLQSRDGYIWIVTLDGLVRFDGVRFTVFNTANTPTLPSNRIISMLETRDGNLWMRTEAWDIVRFRDGRFTRFGPEHGLTERAYGLMQDSSGVLWVRTVDGLGRIEGERFVPVARETIRGAVWSLAQRRDGSMWAGTFDGGILRIESDRAERVVTGTPLDSTLILFMAEDSTGALWLSTPGGVWAEDTSAPQPAGAAGAGGGAAGAFRPRPGTVLTFVASHAHPIEDYPAPRPPRGIVLAAVDSDGALWYVRDSRLYREGEVAATLEASYQVTYAFEGFFAPVSNDMPNKVKAGQTVPLKWRLVDANGAPVTNLSSVRVTVTDLACSLGATADLTEESAPGNSGLQNKGNGEYQFNWKTPKEYANSCKTLHLDLGEGITRTAVFHFEK